MSRGREKPRLASAKIFPATYGTNKEAVPFHACQHQNFQLERTHPCRSNASKLNRGCRKPSYILELFTYPVRWLSVRWAVAWLNKPKTYCRRLTAFWQQRKPTRAKFYQPQSGSQTCLPSRK